MTATVLALPAMVDLIRPTPEESETGTFPVLQTLLHVFLHQLGLNQTQVEFRGAQSQQIQDLMKKSDGRSLEVRIVQDKLAKEEESENVLLEISKEDSKAEKKGQDGEANFIIESGEMVVIEKKKSQQVSLTTFSRLEGKVKSLQAQVESLGTQVLPSDEALLSRTRSADQATPISDLLQAMNITKRMSGAEEGIDKLASLLETVAKEYADLKLLLDKVHDELGLDVVETMKEIKLAADYAKKMRPRAELYEKALVKRDKSSKGVGSTADLIDEEVLTAKSTASSRSFASGASKDKPSVDENEDFRNEQEGDRVSSHPEQIDAFSDVVSVADEKNIEKFTMLPDTNVEAVKINDLIMDQELIRRQMEFMTAQINTLADFSEKILPEILEGLPGMEQLKKRIATIRGKTGSDLTLTTADWELKRSTLTVEQRVEDLELKTASHSSKLRRQDALFCDKYDAVLNTIRDIHAGINFIKVKFGMDDPATLEENIFDPNNIKMCMEKTTVLTEEVQDLYQNFYRVKTDVEKTENQLTAVSEELEGIHSVKVDRFEIDDLLADKADCTEVQNKVSTEVFEEFCISMCKGIDFAIKNTTDLEKQMEREVDRLVREIEMKLDKTDASKLREELDAQIAQLSRDIQRVANAKAYNMASGSKKRLFTGVNCVACDAKVTMEVEEDRVCEKTTAKPHLNAKPYVTVKLEQLKKLSIKNPGAKNLRLHEQIMKNYAMSVGFDLLPDHDVSFIKRYCGGAGTLINPKQRLAKIPTNTSKTST